MAPVPLQPRRPLRPAASTWPGGRRHLRVAVVPPEHPVAPEVPGGHQRRLEPLGHDDLALPAALRQRDVALPLRPADVEDAALRVAVGLRRGR